jgi:hypothetical protein
MSRRTERVGEQLRGEIARVLHEELRDPRIGFVTLTRIDVAPDLSHAVVYWSRVEAEEEGADLEEAARGLASAPAGAGPAAAPRAGAALPPRPVDGARGAHPRGAPEPRQGR